MKKIIIALALVACFAVVGVAGHHGVTKHADVLTTTTTTDPGGGGR